MSNFSLALLTFVGVVCVVALFVLNSYPLLSSPQGKTWIPVGDVRGSAVENDKVLYTLNFEQQNSLIEMINQSRSEKQKPSSNHSLNPQKIIVYRFDNKPEIVIQPIEYTADDNLVYSVPTLFPDGVLVETSGGKLKQLLIQAYD